MKHLELKGDLLLILRAVRKKLAVSLYRQAATPVQHMSFNVNVGKNDRNVNN